MPIINTVTNKCRRCYSCVRNCPVKAIKMEAGQAGVSEDTCICCGLCNIVCSQQAKQVRDDTVAVRKLLAKKKFVVAILAPSFVAAFDVTPLHVIGLLKRLGFAKVCDVAYGAELVAAEYAKLLSQPLTQPVLTSPCPAVISLVEKHFPALVGNLATVVSPMIATARAVRQLYGQKISVVFIGPCVAKKQEIEHPAVQGEVDTVLTFTELKTLLSENALSLQAAKHQSFDGPVAGLAAAFPLAGGLLKAMQINRYRDILDKRFIVTEGRQQAMEMLRALEQRSLPPTFVDILFCRGCIDGPDFHHEDKNYYQRCVRVSNYVFQRQSAGKAIPNATQISLSRKYLALPDKEKKRALPEEEQVKKVLEATGKFAVEDELNCGACGYDTCREKAVAVCQGLAEVDMCLPFLLQKTEQEIDRYKKTIERLELSQGLARVIVGNSPKVEEIRKFVLKASQSISTVLLTGESGTGKGLVARAIHNSSKHREGNFVHVNCSAIPESLLESEIFGYESGAFTGAQKNGKIGKFEQAHNGTIFLDEIGDMPLVMQAKLLRVLQEKVIERVGGTHSISVNVRIIAATNKNLIEEISRGRFREDLYYRVNVLTVSLPPLREIAEDIPLLAEKTVTRISNKCGLMPRKISEEAMQVLCRFPWPGNVRELENVLERMLNMVEDIEIGAEHLPAFLCQREERGTDARTLEKLVAEVEKNAIAEALKSTGYNRVKAAELLGINRSSLYIKINKYNLK